MDKTRHTGFIGDDLCRKSAEFEKIHFLAVKFEDFVVGIWYADKWQRFFGPISLESSRVFRPCNDDFGFSFDKFGIILAQPRHVPAAERSDEPSIKYQHYIFSAFEIG